MLDYCQLNPKEQVSIKFHLKLKTFPRENAFVYAVCKMTAILSRPQCLNEWTALDCKWGSSMSLIPKLYFRYCRYMSGWVVGCKTVTCQPRGLIKASVVYLSEVNVKTTHRLQSCLIRKLNRKIIYRKTSNIGRTNSQNLNDSRLVLPLSLFNPLKPGVKSGMKM